ncbi:MAG TPA: hypothetical protein DCM87_07635 [Planctomycetes bacterium]|nr:hypothetical protein [Planctomycetota bacterium]
MNLGTQRRKRWQRLSLGKLESREDQLLRQQKFSNTLSRSCIILAFILLVEFLVLEGWLRTPALRGLGLQTAALVLMVALVNVLGWIGLMQIFPQAIDAVASFHRLVGILVAYMLLAKFVFLFGFPHLLAPMPLLAITATLMYSKHLAVYLVAGFSLFTGFMSAVDLIPPPAGDAAAAPFFLPLDVPLTLALLLGGIGAVIATGRIRAQSQPITIGFFAGLLHVVVVSVCNLLAGRALEGLDAGEPFWRLPLVFDSLCGLANGFICGVAVTCLLPTLEYLFDVVTERRLRELADLSNELLRTFALRAPGSFTHAQNVAYLASEAAVAIGADALLTRVGAYYHDIGKLYKPEYFVENLSPGSPNPHDRLSPEMSRLVITSHVKDGLAIAEEENLPPKVAAMIPMHHGTTVIQYFYLRAKSQAEAGGREDLDIELYRYPGPKPTFKEAAILMLADLVEATSRTVAEPTPPRLKDMIHSGILKRLQDGELDDSEITMRELSRIEESFLRTLSTQIFHGRIPYPKTKETMPKVPAPQSR